MTNTTTCSAPDVDHPGFPCAHPVDELTADDFVGADLGAILDLDHEPVANGRWSLCRSCGHRTRADEVSGVVRHDLGRYDSSASAELRERLALGWTWPDASTCAVCAAVARVPSANRPGQLVCIGCGKTRRAAEVEAARLALQGTLDRLAQLGYLSGHPAAECAREAIAALDEPRTGSA